MLYHLQSYSSFVTAPILIIIFLPSLHPLLFLFPVFIGHLLRYFLGHVSTTLLYLERYFEDIGESLGNGAHDSHAGSSSQNIYNLH